VNPHWGAAAAVAALLCFPPAIGLAAQREITYSVDFRGALTADRSTFARVVAKVYADPRGWSLGDTVEFRRVPQGGEFTIWLAASDAMKYFSSACSTAWSCRAGRNVVINEARWIYGSPFWYGKLDDYRAMIINHETGHWLGLDHAACARPGVLAPVMMQQSEGPAPCLNNAWPLPSERAAVAKSLGL
jgi:Protein of unknown function (DUF3152)